MLTLTVLYAAHHGIYVRVRKSHPWSPEHVVGLAVDTQWWDLLPASTRHVTEKHPEPPAKV